MFISDKLLRPDFTVISNLVDSRGYREMSFLAREYTSMSLVKYQMLKKMPRIFDIISTFIYPMHFRYISGSKYLN